MNSFLTFTLVLTVIYVIYYAVVIAGDLREKPSEEKKSSETFDVSDMTGEEQAVEVSDSDAGFSVGGDVYKLSGGETETPAGPEKATADPAKKNVLEKANEAENNMEEINPSCSDEMAAEELNSRLIHGDPALDNLYRVKVEPGPDKV